MEADQIKEIMYALAVNRRPRSRLVWLRFRGLNKLFKFKRFSLLKYWENRIRNEPAVAQWANQVYEEYLENLNSHHSMPEFEADKISKRQEVCSQCEWREDGGINNLGVCGQCGCNIWAKTRIPTAACPIKKW